jgi:hypothetical protein
LQALEGVTHVIYAVRFDHAATPAEPIDINLQMLENLMNVVGRRAARLRHVHLVHGTKYYGAPYGRYKTPSKESDARCLIENFYYAQQDRIIQMQRGKPWTWSISRPQAVSDDLPHIARSIPWGVAVYASICREKGVPLSFPSSIGAYQAIYQCTEATHLAKAITWIATHDSCANHAFNVTNGDYFRWENLWPVIAEYFEIPVASPRPLQLSKMMSDQAACWDGMVKKYHLKSRDFNDLVLWPYLDFALKPDYDRMSDVTKLRKFGFHDVVDTQEMFIRYFESYRKKGLIPLSSRRYLTKVRHA